ncbi:MATE family efflux transporter [Solicola gregarius]|uniref:MATE family efflux transporter n=1 Tax=Solicola gregarius TaxID=2908642 RepID=A0AA46TM68_9ACTN|nr:MATE family efflux transporter [Solicola gregarius]UYM07851.1 MATE family efflux transporter [Solicola gregarius]
MRVFNADDRQILKLAIPAFAALVSEPLFLLADTAIVGHLGTTPLAGLAIAATVLQTLIGLCVFLAYGTTASVGRRIGAGDLRGAMDVGIAGGWLALLVGGAMAVVCVAGADVIVGWFGASAGVHEQGVTYLRVAAFGLPAMLLVFATTGVLRGMQDLRTPLVVAVAANIGNVGLNVLLVYGFDMGIAGSALGTTLAQWGSAAYLTFVIIRAARREGSVVRPHRGAIGQSARSGVALIVRTLTLRATFLLATAVATTMGDASLAAHQIALTIVSTLAFALDALAIAGQALTGRALGAGDVTTTKRLTRRMMGWGWWAGVLAAAGLLALHTVLPPLFSSDQAVQDALVPALVVVALIQPISGIVFVLDGVLIGAGDGTYLAWAGIAVLAAYAPLVGAVWLTDAGLASLWWAYGGFILARMVTLVLRERSDAWLVTGAGA